MLKDVASKVRWRRDWTIASGKQVSVGGLKSCLFLQYYSRHRSPWCKFCSSVQVFLFFFYLLWEFSTQMVQVSVISMDNGCGNPLTVPPCAHTHTHNARTRRTEFQLSRQDSNSWTGRKRTGRGVIRSLSYDSCPCRTLASVPLAFSFGFGFSFILLFEKWYSLWFSSEQSCAVSISEHYYETLSKSGKVKLLFSASCGRPWARQEVLTCATEKKKKKERKLGH